MNAASSINNKETASDRPASLDAEVALIWDPFDNRSDNLLFSSASILSHEGKLSYINLTFVTILRAVSCFVAIHSTFLSL
jgi:hypothetical protein